MADLYKGIAGSPITHLTADISANQTTIPIADDSALPDAPNICTIGYGEHLETIKYETKSNGVLQNVTRGIEGIPRAWPAGTEVARFFTAYDHNAIIENFNSHKADYVSRLGNIQVLQSGSGANGLVIDRNLENGIYVLLIGRDNGMYLISVFEGNGSIGEIFPVTIGGAFNIQIKGTRLQVDFGGRYRNYVLLRVS